MSELEFQSEIKIENSGKFLSSREMYHGVPVILHKSFENFPEALTVNLTYEQGDNLVPVIFTRMTFNPRTKKYKIASYGDKIFHLIVLPSKNIDRNLYTEYYDAALVSKLCYRLGVYYLGEMSDPYALIETIE